MTWSVPQCWIPCGDMGCMPLLRILSNKNGSSIWFVDSWFHIYTSICIGIVSGAWYQLDHDTMESMWSYGLVELQLHRARLQQACGVAIAWSRNYIYVDIYTHFPISLYIHVISLFNSLLLFFLLTFFVKEEKYSPFSNACWTSLFAETNLILDN